MKAENHSAPGMNGESVLSDVLGVVIIGRNEGTRLEACLGSITPWASRIVYVDSASTDASVESAKSFGVAVVELDVATRLTAARGRAVGTDALLRRWPGTPFIFFVDGDCRVDPEWPPSAVATLNDDPELAVVCGRRRESDPDFSAYNRLMDLEWDQPAGDAQTCGGDAVVRSEALLEVGGFDPTVVAGEEPELCWRIRQNGWRIRRLPDEMTRHDSAIATFGQWWRREIRSGYGSLDVWYRTGASPGGPFWQMIRRGIFWGVVLPLASLVAILVAWFAGRPAWIGGIIVAVFAMHLFVALKVVRSCRRRGLRFSDSILGAWIAVSAKWAQAIGYWRWLRTPSPATGRSRKVAA